MDRGGNMLDKRKIRLMIKMASYEKQGAEEDLKISSYYKKDYVSMNVWATAIWFTIGYAIVAALIAFCTLEQHFYAYLHSFCNSRLRNLQVIYITNCILSLIHISEPTRR